MMSKRHVIWILFALGGVAMLGALFVFSAKRNRTVAQVTAHRLLEQWQKLSPPTGSPPFWSTSPDIGEMPGYVLTLDKRTPGAGVATFQKRTLWHGFFQEDVLTLRQTEANHAVWQFADYHRRAFHGITFWQHVSARTTLTNLP
jgi:hypothetical protein